MVNDYFTKSAEANIGDSILMRTAVEAEEADEHAIPVAFPAGSMASDRAIAPFAAETGRVAQVPATFPAGKAVNARVPVTLAGGNGPLSRATVVVSAGNGVDGRMIAAFSSVNAALGWLDGTFPAGKVTIGR